MVDAPLEPPLVKLDEALLRFCEAVVESASSSHLCKIGFNLHMFLNDKFNASNLRSKAEHGDLVLNIITWSVGLLPVGPSVKSSIQDGKFS